MEAKTKKENLKNTKPAVKIQGSGSEYKLRENIFTLDHFDIDPELRRELESQNLYPRWISLQGLEQYSGRNRAGWTPYRRKTDTNNPHDILMGKNPNGYIMKKDLVLAVKHVDDVGTHREYLKKRREEMGVLSRRKKAARQMRQSIKESHLAEKARVEEGY